jgi:hypothetical protein
MKLSFIILLAGLARAEVLTLVHPEEVMPEKNTVVWSPLFQATWDKLNAHLGGKPDKVDPPNKLMERLDSFVWKPDAVMPTDSWKTWSGPATSGFLDEVNAEAARMTGEPKGPFRLSHESPGNLAAFGLLDREVSFQKAFLRSRVEALDFRANGLKTPVHFFGCRDMMSGELRESVRVLAFRPVDRSFALQIACKGADDSLILYLPAKALDFSTACSWIRTWREQSKSVEPAFGEWNDALLHELDEVRVPYIDLNTKADLTSKLSSTRYFGKMPWEIMRAEQITRFQLHEKGARVRVEASIEAGPIAVEEKPRIIPRRFVFDRPFFVFLWRNGAEWPYFGAWIGDAGALKAFQQE